MVEHALSAEPTHSRWNRALAPRLTVAHGDVVHMECVDAGGAQVRPGMNVDEFLQIGAESTPLPGPSQCKARNPATCYRSMCSR